MPGSQSYLFSDLDLARRLERTEAHASARFVEARARLFPQSGSRWIDVGGTYALFDGVDSPVTQTFGLGLFQPVEKDLLSAIERFFTERKAPVSHEVTPLAGVAVMALLNQCQYQPIEFTSVMNRSLRGDLDLSAQRNERIRARPLRVGEEKLWAQTAAKGWGQSPELEDFILEMAPLSTQREDTVSFLAELDGKAIATGVLCLHAGVALLAGACTIPEARQQGAQLALLDARLRYAADQGCEIAMMCAAPGSPSQRNAERHGFRIAYTRTKWRLLPP